MYTWEAILGKSPKFWFCFYGFFKNFFLKKWFFYSTSFPLVNMAFFWKNGVKMLIKLKGFLRENWSGLNVARYLTASVRGPVLTLRQGTKSLVNLAMPTIMAGNIISYFGQSKDYYSCFNRNFFWILKKS